MLRRWLPLLFWSALLCAFVMATLPRPPQLPGDPGDKIQHVLAFAMLAGLATAAYPCTRLAVLLLRLSLFGATIELVQSIPALGRDADLADWIADTAAAAAILVAAKVIRHLRKR